MPIVTVAKFASTPVVIWLDAVLLPPVRPAMKSWMSPALTYAWNWVSDGVSSLPLKPPMAITA